MKIRKIAIVIILLLFVAAVAFAAPADTIVYITRTGEKYHTGSCQYLSRSKIEITLGSAVARGYGACSRCKPPALTK